MSKTVVCQNIRVSGVVQGVGFRPFVWRLARELGLGGWVSVPRARRFGLSAGSWVTSLDA